MYKMFGGIGVCLIYQLYYPGGDTTNYYETALAYYRLSEIDINVFVDVVIKGNLTDENYSLFSAQIGYPVFWYDVTAAFVSRLIVPLVVLGGFSFVPTTLLLSWVCYGGVWKLYKLFVNQFPVIKKELALAILFIPSVIFWGSGLLKDTITLSSVGMYTYYFFYFVIKRRFSLNFGIRLVIAALLLIWIKPYIFFAVLPGSIIWFLNEQIAKMSSKMMQRLTMPILLSIGVIAGYFILYQMSDLLGVYAVDNVLERAVEVNLDQKQDYYGGNSFDIGDFEPTVGGVLSKAHLAIAAALFRPYIWDARNPVMIVSAIENSYILLLTVFLIIRLKIRRIFFLIGKHPLLLFSALFSIFFAFSVGLATSNFGSLVRLKIPCIPFFVAVLFILKYFYDLQRGKIKS